jgi:hypothetical protein
MACPVCGADNWSAEGYIRFEATKPKLTYKHTKGDGYSGEVVKWLKGKICQSCGFIKVIEKGSYNVPD